MGYPVSRRLTRHSGSFGPRESFQLPDGSWTPDYHGGDDFTPLVSGTRLPVYAVGAGRIIIADKIAESGDLSGLDVGLQLDGDRSIWWYGHLSAIDVVVGQWVRDLQPLGRMGSTGRSTGVHLHLERHSPRLNVETDPWPHIMHEPDIEGLTSSWQTGTPPVAIGDPAEPETNLEDIMRHFALIADGSGKDFFTNLHTGDRVLVKNHADFEQLEASLKSLEVAAKAGEVHLRLGKYNGGTFGEYLDKLAALS